MKKVYQTVFTDESKNILGNCLQAAYASLLNLPLEAVPSFHTVKDQRTAVVSFLNSLGYRVDYIRELPPRNNRYYITYYSVIGSRIYHAVITKNHKIVHDPRPQPVPLESICGYHKLSKV